MHEKKKEIVIHTDNGVKMTQVVLNSKNSEAVKEAIDELSAYLIKKNKNLYKRLANLS